jgi:hypothetical protein
MVLKNKFKVLFAVSLYVFVIIQLFSRVTYAAPLLVISTEAGQNSAANRAIVDTQDDAWRSQLSSIGACVGGCIEQGLMPNSGTHINGSSVFTSSWGAAVNVSSWTNVDLTNNALTGSAVNNGAYASASGNGMQDDSPRPTSLVSSTNGFFTQSSAGTGARNGILFEFSTPVRAFGAWFGDLETRNIGGTPAVIRLYDSSGVLISDDNLLTSTADQSQCSLGNGAPAGEIPTSNDFNGCGNDMTRWIGFIAERSQLVSKMLVVVGDDDLNAGGGNDNNGYSERISFMGPTIATVPELGVAKELTNNVNNGDGTYTVTYRLKVANNSLEKNRMNDLMLIDDLDTTFTNSIGSAAHSVVSYDISTPTASINSNITINPSYGSAGDWNLLANGSFLDSNDSFEVTIIVQVTPVGNWDQFDNQATVSGEYGKTTYNDKSDDGAIVDANNNGMSNEGGEDDPTPVSFKEAPAIGVAKRLQKCLQKSEGNPNIFICSFVFNLDNKGDVIVTDLSMQEDLSALLANAASWSIVDIGGDLDINPDFDGINDLELLDMGQTIKANDSKMVYLDVEVNIDQDIDTTNQVTFMATSAGGENLKDASQDGILADSNEDGSAYDNNDPTPVVLKYTKVITTTGGTGSGTTTTTTVLPTTGLALANYSLLALFITLATLFLVRFKSTI